MELITIGKIVKPQGIKGEVKIQLYANQNLGFDSLKKVYVDNIGQKTIKNIYVRGDFAYVLFDDFSTIDEAEKLRSFEVSALKTDLKFKDNSFLVSDILGSRVFDQNKKLIGELLDIEQYGAADVWIIFADGRRYSIPYIDSIVLQVLPNQKIIIVNKQNFDEAKICE